MLRSSQDELNAIIDEVDDDGSGEVEYMEFLNIMWNLKSGKGTSKLARGMSSGAFWGCTGLALASVFSSVMLSSYPSPSPSPPTQPSHQIYFQRLRSSLPSSPRRLQIYVR